MVEDVPIIDFVQYVQAEAVKAGLTGADAALPVLSIAAPFSRTASFPAGQVSVRDVAGLYIYDNTLLAVRITGAQLKAYLEFSARYFKKVACRHVVPDGPGHQRGHAVGAQRHAGLQLRLGGRARQAPDLRDRRRARTPGSRILDLAYDGVAVTPAQQFVLAVNNYRQSGGGGFPAVATAPVVYNQQVEIRQLLIDWVTANHTIDPAAVRQRRLEAGRQRRRHHGDRQRSTPVDGVSSARWRSRTERDAQREPGRSRRRAMPATRIVSLDAEREGERAGGELADRDRDRTSRGRRRSTRATASPSGTCSCIARFQPRPKTSMPIPADEERDQQRRRACGWRPSDEHRQPEERAADHAPQQRPLEPDPRASPRDSSRKPDRLGRQPEPPAGLADGRWSFASTGPRV